MEEFCGDFTNLILSFQNVDITISSGDSQANLKGNISSFNAHPERFSPTMFLKNNNIKAIV